jgi:hypothetical protein
MRAKRFHDRFHRAMADVSRMFDRPRTLIDDPEFDVEQKRRLLMQWEYDLRELEVATEENMAAADAHGDAGSNGELLREVRQCLRQLGEAGSASHKQGG